ETRLQDRQITAEERARLEALRHRLMGNLKAGNQPAGEAKLDRPAVSTEGVAESRSLTNTQREMTAQIFADERKQESKVSLATADEIQAPNLPSGLTVEAIFKVISDNSRSMNLCLGEAMRKGEKLSGKMEIEMTIQPEGSVSEVSVSPARMANSLMGQCTMRRIKGWRFPRFNGEPVPVSYPYLLQMGF
ncbi:MAG: AgmX/PglI C-terminal domain-containing protein, partial [Deltaproteobacteria bacterium]|nr:AgmX/PglI C-terminal domain-containing protein [Deltaproteobacteria bacterium]